MIKAAFAKNSRKKAVILIIFLGLFFSTITYIFQSYNLIEKRSGKDKLIDNTTKILITFPSNEDSLSNKTSWVSIAQLDKNHYVFANYANLFLLNNRTNALCTLKPQGINKLGNVYMPTGVFIDQKKNIYVANYKGNNILQGIVNTKNCEVNFIKQFLSENSKGPENISVDSKMTMLVSANYDAGTVTAFNLKNGKELWSTNITNAHGVTISDNKVYATGLTKRKIYELNLDNGDIIQSVGKVGWDPMQSQFLWPTSIYPYKNSELIVSDAHTGYISFLDKKTLKTIRYIGGNGPSYRWFNYPYAAYPIEDNILVLSSLRGNIWFLDKQGTHVIKNLISFKDKWPKLDYSASSFGAGWKRYVNQNGPTINIGNLDYKPGYARLLPVKKGPILRIPDIHTLYNMHAYIYFLQGIHIQDTSLLFSSSTEALLGIVNKKHFPDYLTSTNIRMDSWLYPKGIINVDGTLPLSKVTKEIKAEANAFFALIEKKGWLTPQDFYQLNTFGLDYSKFLTILNSTFQSEPGKIFKGIYDECNKSKCNIEKLHEGAKKYYLAARKQHYLNLDEYILVGMLSGYH